MPCVILQMTVALAEARLVGHGQAGFILPFYSDLRAVHGHQILRSQRQVHAVLQLEHDISTVVHE